MNTTTPNPKKGGISVDTEHIFPIIKKWLYSEKDIFLREIVSNAADAVTKLRRLSSLGIRDGADEVYRIRVSLDKTAGTLTVDDNGIGMTEEELVKYIGSIALSGAVDFIKKYENEAEGQKNGIIGHFGLGFYSSFMVSTEVEVVTKSYTDAPAVHWRCNEAGEYELEPCERDEHGTSVIMHISEEEKEYLSPSKIRSMLDKYCSFMPVEIFFDDGEDKQENAEEAPINATSPLWLKSPADCQKEEYTEFYRKVFADFKEPLFSVHINADYPLNFKGILFFPRLGNEYETIEGQVKLYYNQVFVADNVSEIIPDYLMMLKGVLDCPELPLNVSRSYLQTNTYVSKVSAHIVKKLCDKLVSMCRNDRADYEAIWHDICPFVEYACMKDRKFYDRAKNALLLPLTDGTFRTYEEYLEKAGESDKKTVYYATDRALQAQYIHMYTSEGIDVALCERPIEAQFLAIAEQYMEGVRFVRVDAEVADALKGDGEISENETLSKLFSEISGNDTLTVRFDALKDESVPAILTVSEESRRMEEMMKFYAMSAEHSFPTEVTLVINTSSPLINKLSALIATDENKARAMASYIYKVSLLSQKKFSAEEMQGFMQDSFDMLMKL
ncbi:MAG: molecular chaperone HtpG [Ruminococcaceae bacterium]|nr:molecular chaperone HtpG [Oscillospiraceae bacterium]